MAVATVVIRQGISSDSVVSGKYTCDSSLTATPINVGFVPSVVLVWNATDGDIMSLFSTDMTADKGIKISTAASTMASGGITLNAQTGGTNLGFTVGTDAGVQEASKVFGFLAFK